MLKGTCSNTCKPIRLQASDINQPKGKCGHFGLSCPMFVLHYLHGAKSFFRKSASQEIPCNLWNLRVKKQPALSRNSEIHLLDQKNLLLNLFSARAITTPQCPTFYAHLISPNIYCQIYFKVRNPRFVINQLYFSLQVVMHNTQNKTTYFGFHKQSSGL